MLPFSKPGYLYSIDVESINAGIPYADSFSVFLHYCMSSISENETSITIDLCSNKLQEECLGFRER